MAKAEVSSTMVGMPKAMNSGTVGMKYWIGFRTALSPMHAPMSRSVAVGSRRQSLSNLGPM